MKSKCIFHLYDNWIELQWQWVTRTFPIVKESNRLLIHTQGKAKKTQPEAIPTGPEARNLRAESQGTSDLAANSRPLCCSLANRKIPVEYISLKFHLSLKSGWISGGVRVLWRRATKGAALGRKIKRNRDSKGEKGKEWVIQYSRKEWGREMRGRNNVREAKGGRRQRQKRKEKINGFI